MPLSFNLCQYQVGRYLKDRNYQINEHRAYVNFHRIIEITIKIVITETEAESIFNAFVVSQDKF